MLNITSSSEIRGKFLDFFRERGHAIVPSSSLLPDDPSVLLTTAGMQQFKPYFTGKADPERDFKSRRTASIQKCFRTSDIDEVGDESHLTFFEMMGNFAFGDPKAPDKIGGAYFKKDAIWWAYDFIVKEMHIPFSRIHASVFEGDADVPPDEESAAIWKDLGISEDKIQFSGRGDNFWGPTGAEGPCGPTAEIYIDGVEVWNLVFNEYYCAPDKTLTPLPQKGVDTGMGFERLVAAVQGAPSIFDTDLFKPVIVELRHLMNLSDPKPSDSFSQLYNAGMAVSRDVDEMVRDAQEKEFVPSWRIIADHIRASMFLIVDGVRPSNVEQGYVLRRLLRRTIRHARLLKLPAGWDARIIDVIARIYKTQYREIERSRRDIISVIAQEKAKFERTLDRGIRQFERVVRDGTISAQEAFYLYESYGFPLELTRELAMERGITVPSQSEFQKEFEKHQEKSRAGMGKKFGGHGLLLSTGDTEAASEEDAQRVTRLHTATHLMHQALRQVLGGHVRQMGSDITPERTRFDFTHPAKMTPDDIEGVEAMVNEKIREDIPVMRKEMSYADALKTGALAFFKEKYPDRVSVYTIGDFSKELCGGPHVSRTGEIGHFKILKEESSSAGVRRIRATVE